MGPAVRTQATDITCILPERQALVTVVSAWAGNSGAFLQCRTTNNSRKTNRVARNRAKKIRPMAAKTLNVRTANNSGIASAKIRPSARNNVCEQG